MKQRHIYILFLLTAISCSRKGPIGLYNSCDEFGTHMCRQLKIQKDSTFTLYDKLHMREWYIINGRWIQRGDTLSLTSYNQPYHLDCNSSSESDSIAITATTYGRALTFFYIHVNGTRYKIADTLQLKFSKYDIKSASLDYEWNDNQYDSLDLEELKIEPLCDSLKIQVNANTDEWVYLENTKFVYSENQLFPFDSTGNKIDSFSISKVPNRKLKYRKRFEGKVIK